MCTIDVESNDSKTPPDAVNVNFWDVTYQLPKKKDKGKIVLDNVSGQFSAGRMTAILGPSGAGKSSLLNILSGFKKTGVRGVITVNNMSCSADQMRRISAYIPQNISLLPKLTVYETIHMSCDFKLSGKVQEADKNIIVDEILRLLNLSKIANSEVSKLSGGERKRLSIAIDLVTNPPVMFFDEPTSGLDSVSSLQVCTYLKSLADRGKTIVCVIHQPSSSILQLFDDLLVLSQGKCIYSGSLDNIVKVLSEVGLDCPQYYNRADFILEVASLGCGSNLDKLTEKVQKTHRKDLESNEKDSETSPMIPLPNLLDHKQKKETCKFSIPSTNYPISSWRQFCILTKRGFTCTTRDFMFAQLRLLCHILVGFLLGVVFYDVGNDASKVLTNLSCLFFFLMFIFFANAMPTVLIVPLETSVFLREHLNNWYSVGAYFSSKIVADLPLQLICPTCFVAIAYFMTGQPAEWERFFMLAGICLLTAVLAQAVGLISGAAFNMQLGVFVVPSTSILMLVFSGFFIKFNELLEGLRPIAWISYFRYSFEGSMHAIYGHNRTELECHEHFCLFRTSSKVLSFMDMEGDRYWHDVGFLCVWIVSLYVILYFIFRYKICKAR